VQKGPILWLAPLLLSARRREIGVFISSTFRDMQEEREELVKQIAGRPAPGQLFPPAVELGAMVTLQCMLPFTARCLERRTWTPIR